MHISLSDIDASAQTHARLATIRCKCPVQVLGRMRSESYGCDFSAEKFQNGFRVFHVDIFEPHLLSLVTFLPLVSLF